MFVERVHVIEDWATMGHRVIVRGRPYPGAPASCLRADGEWEPITEGSRPNPSGEGFGFTLPDGALDAIVAEHLKVAAPQPATERHLSDAIAVRDRLLALVEKRK